MSRVRICYVIASYGGPRRYQERPIRSDVYLRLHMASLDQVRHGLAQVVVVDNQHDVKAPGYDAFLEELKDRREIGGAPLLVAQRPNQGMSYGAWAEVFNLFHQRFDYYLLCEDDHIFVRDGFDARLLALIEEAGPDYGVVCGILRGDHPGKMTGIYRAKALDDVWLHAYELQDLWTPRNSLPCSGNAEYCHAETTQRLWGQALTHTGWRMADWTDFYRASMFHVGGGWEHHYAELPWLCAPSALFVEAGQLPAGEDWEVGANFWEGLLQQWRQENGCS